MEIAGSTIDALVCGDEPFYTTEEWVHGSIK